VSRSANFAAGLEMTSKEKKSRSLEASPGFQNREWLTQRFFDFLVGLPFRLVFAILRSSALLIDSYMPLDAPLREDFLPSPLLAANAAPAAICCFFDFAGIQFFLLLSLVFLPSSLQSPKGFVVRPNKTMRATHFIRRRAAMPVGRTDFQVYRLSISLRRSSLALPSLC
jgi:hypothetical protein